MNPGPPAESAIAVGVTSSVRFRARNGALKGLLCCAWQRFPWSRQCGGGGVAPPSAPGALWGGEVPLPLPTPPPPELSASPSTVPKAGVPESAGKSSPGCGPQARVPTGPDTILSGGIFGFEVEVFVRTQQRPNLETSGLIFTQRFADGERGPGLSVMQNPHVHSEDAVSHQATPQPRVQETPRERPLH